MDGLLMETKQIINGLMDRADRVADQSAGRIMKQAAKRLRELDVADKNVGHNEGCDYCQEDADGYRRMFGAFAITNPFHGKAWCLETAHCKPRNIYFCPQCGKKLAEPPKEVDHESET